ncbi:MAG: ImmA/IrrE family metallo-endopeptidase [Paracoccaceae bacterium]|nr:ImmA/IrrE family metallo-endopeptidase [Paracoccaceae bacterium]
MNDGQPPSVGSLASALGFEVEFTDLPNGISGYLTDEPFAPKGKKIVINANHRRTRQRWTALHEIAHYYLHPRYTDPLEPEAHRAGVTSVDHFYATDEELIEEREANEWVEAIVFEQSALQAAVSMHGDDLQAIAWKFGVSVEALKIRLRKGR